VDHSYAAYDNARPWRTATLVASLVAAVELVVIVVVAVAALGDHVRAEATRAALAPPAKKEAPAAPGDVLPRAETSVIVLNGNGRAGAATNAGDLVRGKGYIVAAVGNAPASNSGGTAVMYRAGKRGEAERLARDLGVKVVGPLDGLQPRDLLGAHLALVLGS
jgi:hypothetical protein